MGDGNTTFISNTTAVPGMTNVINNTIINNKNLLQLQQKVEEETLKKNLSLLYIFYLLRYNNGNNNLYPKIETYLSLKTKNYLNSSSMSQNDTKLMNNNQKEIENILISLKNSVSDPDIKEIEKVIDGTSDFIYKISQYILNINNQDYKIKIIQKIKDFLENHIPSNIFYYDNTKKNLNNKVINLYNGEFRITQVLNIRGSLSSHSSVPQATKKDIYYESGLKKNIKVLKENNVLKYRVSDQGTNVGTTNGTHIYDPTYTFSFVNDGWYWVDDHNNKLKINQNGKDYIYQYNCRLSLWGWFCGYDDPGLKVIKSSGSEELQPKGNTYFGIIKKKSIPNNEMKLLLLATIKECYEEGINDIDSFNKKITSIVNAVFSKKCDIGQYSIITQNVIEYIRFKNPKNCMI